MCLKAVTANALWPLMWGRLRNLCLNCVSGTKLYDFKCKRYFKRWWGLLTSFNLFSSIFCWVIETWLHLNSCSSQTLSTVSKQSEIVELCGDRLLISPQHHAYSIYLITSRRTNKFTFSISYITTNNKQLHLLSSLGFSLVFHFMNLAESVGRIH